MKFDIKGFAEGIISIISFFEGKDEWRCGIEVTIGFEVSEDEWKFYLYVLSNFHVEFNEFVLKTPVLISD